MILLLIFAWYWRDVRDGWRRGSFEAARRRDDWRYMARFMRRLIAELERVGAFDAWAMHVHWRPTR